jgi:carotenoid cleavage dioxygenase-like enzyme
VQITTITFGPPDVQGGGGARRVHVKSKFVHTHEFDQEAQADTFLYR